jgi:hypothetical protein
MTQVAQLQLQPIALLAREIHYLSVCFKDLADCCTPIGIVTYGRVCREYRVDKRSALAFEDRDPLPVTSLCATEQFPRQRQE